MSDTLATIVSVLSIVLALGGVGAWLITHGRNMAINEQTRNDVDGLGRKVENIRKDHQTQIDRVKDDHDLLAREVSEIKATTSSTHTLVQQLVAMHMEDRR